MFSVVIPTLQRSPDLWPLVQQCSAHPLVLEVLVINNAKAPLTWDSPKVRVLQQAENIYVNPAWNLGALEARGDWLAIINDDVRFGDAAFDVAARLLRTGLVGLVAPDEASYLEDVRGRPTWRLQFEFNAKLGTFMCLRRADYSPIPDELKIWGGDNWLFWSQLKPNATIKNVQFVTDMGTTTSDPEFSASRSRESARATELLDLGPHRRWWRLLGPAMSAVRRFARGLKTSQELRAHDHEGPA